MFCHPCQVIEQHGNSVGFLHVTVVTSAYGVRTLYLLSAPDESYHLERERGVKTSFCQPHLPLKLFRCLTHYFELGTTNSVLGARFGRHFVPTICVCSSSFIGISRISAPWIFPLPVTIKGRLILPVGIPYLPVLSVSSAADCGGSGSGASLM